MNRISPCFILACCLVSNFPAFVAAEPAVLAKALKPGDTIAFVAPAGPLDHERMERARTRLHEMGFKTQVPADLYRKHGYLAGTDEARAAELNAAFANPDIDAIFPGTGGYGTTRILDQIDFDAIRANPKIFIGFSDITGLHTAINRHTGLVTFHSPNPMWGLGSEDNLTAYSAEWFWRAILADRYTNHANESTGYTIRSKGWTTSTEQENHKDLQSLETVCQLAAHITVTGGKATGRTIGGNLSLVAALMGTPYEIETDGRLLFLEDVGEAPYRVDRMLCTMRLAGKFDHLKGVVLGQFTRRKEEDLSDDRLPMEEVLDGYFAHLGVPVIRNFPFGHHRCNATIPIGIECELDADQGTIRVLQRPVICD